MTTSVLLKLPCPSLASERAARARSALIWEMFSIRVARSLPPVDSVVLTLRVSFSWRNEWRKRRMPPIGLGLGRCRRGFTRQPENSKRAHLRVPALQTPPNFHEKTPREREKKSENGSGRGKKKSAKCWAPPPSGPPPFEPSRCGAHPSGTHPSSPNPWSPNFFLVWAPPLCAPDPSGPHSSGLHPSTPLPSSGGPLGLHFFWVWAPTFLIFIMLLILFFFCAFLIVSISCHF